MNEVKIIGEQLSNIPWQQKPSACKNIVWRYSENPILDRNPMSGMQGIYNSAVVPFEGGFVGVFRAESKNRTPFLHLGKSDDGINWNIQPGKIKLIADDPLIDDSSQYAYDPRICKIEDTYYISWCTGHCGPTIGLACTKDFEKFYRLENAFLPFNRNGVLFPRTINGNFVMFNRPSDDGNTPFGDIYISQSPDMCYWGKHRLVMKSGGQWWQSKKIGAGPVPIETSEGWLIIYHGVMGTCNGFVYSAGAAILDIDAPWKVLYRTNQHIMTPDMPYEYAGHVPNVVFPCAALCDAATGKIAIYYGAADTSLCMAFCNADELVEFTKKNSEVF